MGGALSENLSQVDGRAATQGQSPFRGYLIAATERAFHTATEADPSRVHSRDSWVTMPSSLPTSGPTAIDPALIPARPVRFAAVVSHPIQHYAPMFRDLAAVPNVVVRVLYCCDWGVREYADPDFAATVAWDVPLLDGYDSEFLPVRRRPEALTFREVDNPAVGERLAAFAPDVVWLHGYGFRTLWRARGWCVRQGHVRSLLFGDSELLHRRSLPRRVLKCLFLRWYYRPIDGFITIGDNNEAYYRHYGVPDEKLFRGACPVDVARFRQAIDAAPTDSRRLLRQRFGLAEDAVVVLFSGKFIARKRPMDVVRAVATCRSASSVPVQALLIGSGPDEPALRAEIRHFGAQDVVRLSGFINQAEMPLVLQAGDIMAVSSDMDPHPLVVAEAMAVGNPIVASDRVGCVGPTDAARPGINAVVYPCGDTVALAEAIRSLAEDPGRRRRMASASLELAWTQDTRACVRGVLRAIRAFGLGASPTQPKGTG